MSKGRETFLEATKENSNVNDKLDWLPAELEGE